MKISYTHELPMGHRLQRHNGRCKLLHGHNYLVKVTLEGSVEPRTSMLIDFHDLKAGVRRVLDQYDHAFVLQAGDPACEAIEPFAKVLVVPAPPTAEYLLVLWREQLQTIFPTYAVSLTVHETRDCEACE